VAPVSLKTKWIAVVAVVLTMLRVFDLASGFARETQRNAIMNRAISHTERNARLFPVVDACTETDPRDYYYVHYWAYAVIRRGALSPYLFDIPGQTPMRILDDAYTSDDYWEHCYHTEPDWRQVAAGYDYIWSYGEQRYAADIGTVADKVFEDSVLVLYRVRK
jgi:hypothetical protein